MQLLTLTLATLIAVSCASSQSGAATTQTDTGAAASQVTVAQLSQKPDAFVGKRIVVRGKLVNEAANYFEKLDLALTDDKGQRVRVREWMRQEVRQRPPGDSRPAPQSQSSYLDREVELTGVLERIEPEDAAKGKPLYAIRVESAKVVDQPR